MATKLVRLKCQSCGSALDLDMDHLIVYCPYCGQKLLFDVDQIGSILLEKEKTKQKVIDRDIETKRIENEQKRKEDNKAIIGMILMIIMLAVILYFCTIGMR